MHRDLLVPTSGDKKRLGPLLDSLKSQSVQPDAVIFLLHSKIPHKEIEKLQDRIQQELGFGISLIADDNGGYQAGNGVGYDRNFLIQQGHNEYIFMIDDDNVFDSDLIEKCFEEYKDLQLGNSNTQFLFSPLIQRRTSGTIQSAGIAGFNRWLPRYTYAKPGSSQERIMIGANSLLGPRKLFQSIGFDARFKTCLEDIDFSYGVWKSGSKILVSDTIKIQHMESEKTLLQQKFLGSPVQAQERSKNRILFAKKHANLFQKIGYFALGLRGQTFWFLVLSLVYGGSNRFRLIGSVLKGTFEGIFTNF